MIKPLKNVGRFGLLLIPFTILLLIFGPKQSKENINPYGSAIVEFEFVSNKVELETLFEKIPTNYDVHKLDIVNYLDFPFMVIYGSFLFLFLSKIGDLSGERLIMYAKWIAPIIVICDLCENLQLLRLTKDYLTGSQYSESTFQLLETFTWSKWLLLALAFAIISVGLIRTKPRHPIVSMLLLIPIFLGVAAFSTHRPAIEDVFTGSVFLSFFVLLIYCFVFRQKQEVVA